MGQNNNPTFEKRNLMQRKFLGSAFVSGQLVFLDGIYYHYQFKQPVTINATAWYQVVNNFGNQLVIQKVSD